MDTLLDVAAAAWGCEPALLARQARSEAAIGQPQGGATNTTPGLRLQPALSPMYVLSTTNRIPCSRLRAHCSHVDGLPMATRKAF